MEAEVAAAEGGFTSVSSKRSRRKRRAAGGEEAAAGSAMETTGSAMETAGPRPSKRPAFPPVSAEALGVGKGELRKVAVPANRYTPLKENWMKIFTPIVEHLQLQIRFNLKTRNVEIKLQRLLFSKSSLSGSVNARVRKLFHW
ncbi:rna-binding protein pno1 [Limosa lapponica baueri]|uniref:Rna-binding protein pno1 n=1 Tax=Limosa lapponica baueri TaxID=1758121 RepID=A0A2I0TCF0_LIMLA|nr:rna-binding protein pno1 [Limosa lapponica baueri]